MPCWSLQGMAGAKVTASLGLEQPELAGQLELVGYKGSIISGLKVTEVTAFCPVTICVVVWSAC